MRLPDTGHANEIEWEQGDSISFILLPCWQARQNRCVSFAGGLALRHSSATGAVRGDEDDAWSPKSGRGLGAGEEKVPAISLATVYKNIHLFVESGVFREVSLHHGSVRVEMDREPHHHNGVFEVQRDYGYWREGAGAGPEAGSIAYGISGGALCGGCDGVCAKCQQAGFIVR